MRKNVDFIEKIASDYRNRIIVDRDNPILAFKSIRDRYINSHGAEAVGKSYLGSNASEDALTWNVFRILYRKNRISCLFKGEGFGRIRSLALWCLTPDIKHWNKRFQFSIGESIRRFDGIFKGQTTEPDVIMLGSTGLCIIECKLGHPNKPLSHLWEGPLDSIKKRIPIYAQEVKVFERFLRPESTDFYQLIRMAFYVIILARKYNVRPYLISLTNANNWELKIGGKAPRNIWNDFQVMAKDILPDLRLRSLFWQDLIEIPEIKKIDSLYRYLKNHPCL